jgi:hypothetical protein
MDLRSAIQALAAPADAQLGRFPDFVVAADELALDFDDALLMFRQANPSLTTDQDAELKALDALLGQMSGTANAHLWTPRALHTASEWVRVRERAQATLRAFDWPIEPPPPTDNVYVPGRAT